jgi:hypothetical protein
MSLTDRRAAGESRAYPSPRYVVSCGGGCFAEAKESVVSAWLEDVNERGCTVEEEGFCGCVESARSTHFSAISSTKLASRFLGLLLLAGEGEGGEISPSFSI